MRQRCALRENAAKGLRCDLSLGCCVAGMDRDATDLRTDPPSRLPLTPREFLQNQDDQTQVKG